MIRGRTQDEHETIVGTRYVNCLLTVIVYLFKNGITVRIILVRLQLLQITSNSFFAKYYEKRCRREGAFGLWPNTFKNGALVGCTLSVDKWPRWIFRESLIDLRARTCRWWVLCNRWYRMIFCVNFVTSYHIFIDYYIIHIKQYILPLL